MLKTKKVAKDFLKFCEEHNVRAVRYGSAEYNIKDPNDIDILLDGYDFRASGKNTLLRKELDRLGLVRAEYTGSSLTYLDNLLVMAVFISTRKDIKLNVIVSSCGEFNKIWLAHHVIQKVCCDQTYLSFEACRYLKEQLQTDKKTRLAVFAMLEEALCYGGLK